MRVLAVIPACSMLAACAGVSPRPGDLAARDLPDASADAEVAAQAGRLAELARRALDQRRFEEAEDMASEALSVDAGAWRARAVLGNALLGRSRTGDPPDLHLQNRGDGETLTAALRSPTDPVVGLLRIRFLAEVGHLSAAAAAGDAFLVRIASSGDPDYVELLATTAGWCYELGEERRALPHLEELVQYRPNSASAHFRLGYCVLHTAINASQAEVAVRAFERCAELSPDDEQAYLAILSAYSRCLELAAEAERPELIDGYRPLAVEACERAARRFPQLAEPWFRRGVIFEQVEDEAASAAYRRALAVDENHLGSLLNLASLLHGQEQPAEVVHDLWRRALAVDAQAGGLQADERTRILALLGQ